MIQKFYQSPDAGSQITPKVQPKQDVNLNPPPDSETGKRGQDAYDDDFNYLKSPSDGSTNEEGVVTPAPVEPPKPLQVSEPTPPSVVTPPTPPPVVATPAPAPSAPVAASGDKGETVEVLRERIVNLQGTLDKKIQDLTDSNKNLTVELETARNTIAGFEELKKGSLEFLSKYVPDMAVKVDTRSYITDILKKEFGEDFVFRPEEAYNRESPSYKFRDRERQLELEVQRQQLDAEAALRNRKEQREALLNTSKQQVMKDYNLTEQQFQEQVEKWSQTITLDYNALAKIRFLDDIVKRAVEDAKKQVTQTPPPPPAPPSPAALGGGTPQEVPQIITELNNVFGDY